ncbi:hypothetical protein JTB14_019557 [Gonioctena quinquepunctata]|nr:hypothetical protein JTB14_019557 [Gonioctena quinquepunctata]
MASTVKYFDGKNIFLTGGSGFIGKVLIEKVLRSCSGVGNIYVLLRGKKGKSIQERLDTIKNMKLFDKLKESDPDSLEKLTPINGDVTELRLGMSEEDRQLITNNAHIIIHSAASVRFDDDLKYSLILNVRGTREVVDLALEVKDLSVFVHISTTYCNTDKKVIEEKIYPPHADWKSSIELAERIDENILKAMSTKYIEPLPNTYTFAKSLGEHVVNDMCKGKIKTVIIRPSVVISTQEEPIPGWNDNFNGPTGMFVAGGKGLLRTILGNPETIQDFFPVDYLVKNIIMVTHQVASTRNCDEVEVYNCCKGDFNLISYGEIAEMGKDLIQDSPFSQILWNPNFSMTSSWYNYYIQVLLFHIIPAFFVDISMRVVGKKPIMSSWSMKFGLYPQRSYRGVESALSGFEKRMMGDCFARSQTLIFHRDREQRYTPPFVGQRILAIQRKIYIANVVLEYFIRNTWIFVNEKSLKLLDQLSDEERAIFGFRTEWNEEEIFNYFRDGKIGVAIYVLKEEFDFTKTKSRQNLWRLWLLDRFVKASILAFAVWYFTVKWNILRSFSIALEDYMRSI